MIAAKSSRSEKVAPDDFALLARLTVALTLSLLHPGPIGLSLWQAPSNPGADGQ
jgi:hypothetical protein